jgi:hypothetical protein
MNWLNKFKVGMRSIIASPDSGNWRSRVRAALLAGACVATAGVLIADTGGPAAPEPSLAGTWVLRAAEQIRPDGTRVTDPSYGPGAQGLLMIDGEGRYSLQIFKPGRPKFASGDKHRGTPEEYEAAVLGMSSHVGRLVVDAANQMLIFQIEFASYPNWEQTEQKRKFQLSGDELNYQVPASAGSNGIIAVSVWRRATPAR